MLYQVEPPVEASEELRMHPNVVVTPHLGASTYDAQVDFGDLIFMIWFLLFIIISSYFFFFFFFFVFSVDSLACRTRDTTRRLFIHMQSISPTPMPYPYLCFGIETNRKEWQKLLPLT